MSAPHVLRIGVVRAASDATGPQPRAEASRARYAAGVKITRAGDAPDGPFEAETFSGAVSRRDYGTIEDPEGTVLLVRFPAGVRTHWHSHPNGQVLFVTEGSGRVGTRDGTVERIGPGDVVVAPANEEHWHGAAEDAGVQHLALNFGVTSWIEPVDGD
jgi:quercetin dioxygenase-like cupin family protein